MRRKGKWIFTALAFILFMILGMAVPDEDLGQRAMVVGMGIDADDDGNILASVQILTASEKEGESAGTRVVETSNKLLTSAMSDITEICGLTVTVTHCNVVILGEKLINSGEAFKYIYSLLSNTYLSDNAYVFVCEGTPRDVFLSKSAFGQNASQYLQLLISKHGTFDDISYKTLRQIIVDHHNIGNTTYLPFLSKELLSPKVPPSSSDMEEEDKNEYSYNLNKVQIIRDGNNVGIYDKKASRAINYVMTEVNKGSSNFTIEKGILGVFNLNNSNKKKYDIEKKIFSVEIKIGATVKDFQPNNKDDLEETFVYQLTENDYKQCEETIKGEIEDFYKEMQSKDADVYEIRQGFYSKFGEKANGIKLSDIKIDVKVELSIEK